MIDGDLWRNVFLSVERVKLRRSPRSSRKAFRKMTPQTPVLRGETFHELRRGAETSTAAREPSARASFFWAPSQLLPGLPRSSRFASVCRRKRFWKKKNWAPSQLKKCQNLGPLAAHQDIYIYIYMATTSWKCGDLRSCKRARELPCIVESQNFP